MPRFPCCLTFCPPLPASQVVESVPSVQLWTNGVQAECASGTCHFLYQPALTPVVSSVAPAAIRAGTTLVIVGSGFSASPGGNRVLLGTAPDAAACEVITASATRLTCNVPGVVAGSHAVVVVVDEGGRGQARVLPGVAPVTVATEVTGVSPRSGSACGGALVTISGSGFAASASGNVVALTAGAAALPCDVVSASHGAVVCRTRALPGACPTLATPPGAPALAATPGGPEPTVWTVRVNGVAAPGTFQTLRPAVVASLSPRVAGWARSVNVTLTVQGGEGGVDTSTVSAVHFGASPCVVSAPTPASAPGLPAAQTVGCRLERSAPPPVASQADALLPLVLLTGAAAGYADPGTAALRRVLAVNSVAPAAGSLHGGTELTINGGGFGTDPDYVSVRLYDPTQPDAVLATCALVSLADDRLVCTVALAGAGPEVGLAVDTGAVVEVVSHSFRGADTAGHAAPCASPASCSFLFAAAATPAVATVEVDGSSGAVVLTGTGLVEPLEVFLGATPCAVQSPTAPTRVECVAPLSTLPAGPLPVVVVVRPGGVAAGGHTYTVPLVLTSASPPVGSFGGGLAVTLTGRGFSATRTTVAFGNRNGTVVSATGSTLVVLAPPAPLSSAGVTVAVTVTVAPPDAPGQAAPSWRHDPGHTMGRVLRHVGPAASALTHPTAPAPAPARHRALGAPAPAPAPAVAALPAAFSYAPTLTPRISAVSPTAGAFAGAAVTITGSGFGAVVGQSRVTVGGAPCAVTSWATGAVVCTLGSAAAGTQAVQLTVEGRGLAVAVTGTSPPRLVVRLEVGGLRPAGRGQH